MIPVTKTFLPPITEYHAHINQIWKSNQLANGGKLLFDLQSSLKEYLNIHDILLTANGTLPLQIALKLLARKGEVITTPFSYVATTSSIVWENCTPRFVDITPDYLTIDETKLEDAITNNTTAILATHVFGNPCNVEAISLIAKKYNLKVIYDAAHCFGVKYLGKSLFRFGDISTCSFHATKLFHTGEGGAMFCEDKNLYKKLFYSHNFGHDGELNFQGLGINAKMSELQAGMGLAVLPHVDDLISAREKRVQAYDDNLSFEKFRRLKIREGTDWNSSYYPLIFENEKDLLNIEKALNNASIFPRRYFYPSLNTLNYVKYEKMKISEKISKTVLCLPLYRDLKVSDIKLITAIIERNIN
jgi:dTDP-4-amino-4,6-dideoxygalactose transaminase